MTPRKKLLAANWKMYKTPQEAVEFARAFSPQVKDHARDEITLCPPFIAIPAVIEAVKGTSLHVGAQNFYWQREGAYTGEVSAQMLVAAGCSHVIIGHSERRQYFGETDATVNLRLKAALAAKLTPIVCVGEVLQERESGITDDVLRRQCTEAFRDIAVAEATPITVAYEPVWAIGTGKTATPEIAAQAHETIRAEAAKAFGEGVACAMRILYGGSVKPDNVKALMAEPQIDGALVGGASLDPKSFLAIVQY